MPKINTTKYAYGETTGDDRLIMRERLMKRFAAHEWVRVVNPDTETLYWQYMPSYGETFEFTPDPMKHIFRDDVEPYELAPGESEVLIGENAYIMVEALYKKLVSKKIIAGRPDMGPGQARNFNWTDGNAQEKWIDKIVIGKEQPGFNRPKKVEASTGVTPNAAPLKRMGRPKTTSHA